MGMSYVIGILGVLLLSHAAYSTIQYRGLLKIMEEEFSSPPFNVVLELFLGLALSMCAALTVSGSFLSIHPNSEENREYGFHYLQPSRQIVPPTNGSEVEVVRSASTTRRVRSSTKENMIF